MRFARRSITLFAGASVILTLASPGAFAAGPEPARRSDFNGDGYVDLAIGVPFESVGKIAYAGVVNVLYGSAAGLSAVGNQSWSANSTGILGVSTADDSLGAALASGDFDADGFAD